MRCPLAPDISRPNRHLAVWLLGALLAAGIPRPAAAIACSGDCDGNGSVTVNELVVAVATALGQQSPAVCPRADRNGNGEVTVDELVRAVGVALVGCTEALAEASLGVSFAAIRAMTATQAVDPGLAQGRPRSLPVRCRSLFATVDPGAPIPPPVVGDLCPFQGAAEHTCAVQDGSSVFTTVYRTCRNYDPFTDNNVYRNGTVSVTVPDPAACLQGEIPEGVELGYAADFTYEVTDALNRPVERFAQRGVSGTITLETAACGGRAAAAVLRGEIAVFRACLAEDESFRFDGTRVEEDEDESCAQRSRASGRFLFADPTGDGGLSVELREASLVARAPADPSRFRFAGSLETLCTGRFEIQTDAPLAIGSGSCPIDGRLNLQPASLALLFGPDGTIGLDRNGDGAADVSFESCAATALGECFP